MEHKNEYIPILKVHKIYLQEFWKKFSTTGRKGVSKYSKKDTLDALIKLSEVKLIYKSSHDRKMFERKKKQSGYQGFRYCFACKRTAEVRHHIILIKHGGRNVKKNIVALCRPCHADIHPWLK